MRVEGVDRVLEWGLRYCYHQERYLGGWWDIAFSWVCYEGRGLLSEILATLQDCGQDKKGIWVVGG